MRTNISWRLGGYWVDAMDLKLFLNGVPVPTVDINEGLHMLSSWLPGFKKSVTFLGHNIKTFDIKHFLRHLTDNQLAEKFVMIALYRFLATLQILIP